MAVYKKSYSPVHPLDFKYSVNLTLASPTSRLGFADLFQRELEGERGEKGRKEEGREGRERGEGGYEMLRSLADTCSSICKLMKRTRCCT